MRKLKVFLPERIMSRLAQFAIDDPVDCQKIREIEAAGHRLQGLGWSLLPVAGKRPTTPRGVYNATRSAEELSGWIRLSADRVTGLGVACGEQFDVVDIDTHRPDLWIDQVANAYEGPIALTPHGIHLYVLPFATVSSVRPIPQVDVRTRGSYVVTPPSVSSDGTPYLWIAPPWEASLRPCPYRLRCALLDAEESIAQEREIELPCRPLFAEEDRLDRYIDAAVVQMGKDVESAEVGARNKTLYAKAVRCGGYVASGLLDPERAVSALGAAAFRAGLTLRETQATIRSGIRAGQARPWVPVLH